MNNEYLQFLFRNAARFGVGRDVVLIRRFGDEGRLIHRLGDDVRHPEEAASSFAESEVRYFVGCIEHAGDVTSSAHRIIGET